MAAALHSLVGQHLAVTLTDGSSFDSDLLTVDDASGLVVFRQEPTHTYMKADYRLVPTHAIATASVHPTIAARPIPAFRDVLDAELRDRDLSARDTAEKTLATRGNCPRAWKMQRIS
jgi:hypothetical protein